ncbi:hypothetical protein ACFL13_01825 [Patescibacteria group bacterium]
MLDKVGKIVIDSLLIIFLLGLLVLPISFTALVGVENPSAEILSSQVKREEIEEETEETTQASEEDILFPRLIIPK